MEEVRKDLIDIVTVDQVNEVIINNKDTINYSSNQERQCEK